MNKRNRYLTISIVMMLVMVSFSMNGCSSISATYYGSKYCSEEPNPKTWIGKTVENPISIYFEDNVYPGFDDTDAKLMVNNYLDGVQLQKMALNTPDGQVNIYSYSNVPQSYIDLVKEGYIAKKDWQEKNKTHQEAFKKMYDKNSHEINKEFEDEWKEVSTKSGDAHRKNEVLIKEIEAAKVHLDLVIIQTTKEQMPVMNYTVKTDEIHLSDTARKVLYSKETKIIDNREKKVIGYNHDIMRLYSANLIPDFAGGRYFYPHSICGYGTELFERYVFTSLSTRGSNHTISLNKKLYSTFTSQGQ